MNTFQYLWLIVKDELLSIRELLVEQRWLALCLLILIGAGVVYLDPIPPRSISIAAGDQGGAYWKTAEKYANYFAEQGVELKIVEAAGSLENAALLADHRNDVQIAFVQGGVLSPDEAASFYSLGSVGYEPMWVFYRKDLPNPPKSLQDLLRFRVGIGPAMGGTQKLFYEVMKLNGVREGLIGKFPFAPYRRNLEDFEAGKLDVLVKVAAMQDESIQRLIEDPNIRLLSIQDSAAYAKSLQYVYALSIPSHSINIEKQIPAQDISLIGTTASLIVDKKFNSDLQMLLLVASRDIQRSSQSLFFSKRGEFPAYVDPTIEASPTALHYYDYGVSPGMRYLPFWLAGFINRMWILLLSVIAFTYPISKLSIRLREIRFHIKHRRMYEELLAIEQYLCDRDPSCFELERMSERLKKLNREAINVRVPVGSEFHYFELLQAVELLRSKVKEEIRILAHLEV